MHLIQCYTFLVGEGNGSPLQCSCLEHPMDGGAWWPAVLGVAKSRTRLSDFPFTFHFHALEKEMATHSSVLAWRIPGTREPGGLPSMGSHRVRHDWSDLAAVAAAYIPCGSAGKESACNAGDLGSIPGLGRSPGEGEGYPHQSSGLENSMDCIVHGVTKSRTRLSDFHFHTYSQPSLSLLCLFTQLYSTLTLWTVNPLSMGFFRQGYWSELPFPSPGDLSDPGIEP